MKITTINNVRYVLCLNKEKKIHRFNSRAAKTLTYGIKRKYVESNFKKLTFGKLQMLFPCFESIKTPFLSQAYRRRSNKIYEKKYGTEWLSLDLD